MCGVDDEDLEDSTLIVQRLFSPDDVIDGLTDLDPVIESAVAKFRAAADAACGTVLEGASLKVQIVLGITPTMGAITVSAPIVAAAPDPVPEQQPPG